MRLISEFFKPHVKSTIPAKRPSPSTEEEPQEVAHSRRDGSDTNTQRAAKKTTDGYTTKAPPSSVPTPKSVRLGSGTPLSVRRRRASYSEDPIAPPSTYKKAPILGADTQEDDTSRNQGKYISFSDLSSSSRAVVRDGELIEILASDSDDEGSLGSLGDFSWRDRDSGSQSIPKSSAPKKETKVKAEHSWKPSFFMANKMFDTQYDFVGIDRIKALSQRAKELRSDISTLTADHFSDEERERNVKRARADVAAATKAAEPVGKPALDKTLLAAVVTGSEEDDGRKVARIMGAINRTEALASDSVFLFFGVNGLNDWHDEDPAEHPFPPDAIPDHLWRDGVNESRLRAYLSGYVSDLAARRLISDDALNWTFGNIVLERQDEARQAYVRCLQNASSSWIRANIRAQDVQTVFQTLGAEPTSLQDSIEIKPRHQLLKEPAQRNPKYLLAVLDLFQHICANMGLPALSSLASIICRLAIDGELTSDGRVSSRIDAILERLLSLPNPAMCAHVADRILSDMGQHLKDAVLQAQLLSHILPSSLTASRIRIRLAQAFLFGVDNRKGSASGTPKISLHTLAEYVSNSPDFNTRLQTSRSVVDYTALRARTHVLDIAISDGGRPAEFPSRSAEQAFNKSVDCLADAINATFVAIGDAGASHMTRTECKGALQALYWRLLYGVRTVSRPSRRLFMDAGRMRDAEEVEFEERSKEFMSRFLGKKLGKLPEKGGEEEV
ncbi:hypothetical protein AYL99_03305 [Fonsecaea erecta]|uniref:Uncharacterized protein n=1 Tax=Fonsecaea erecta TaxID=1367422 RepID=A0A178ZMR2_9EURO|nr:hypothetical protein AYL99_03305 [Fonsecaea erecta]OAP61104.1 hypothetical protein AYL99_03305 [Fonsecaea erecta]